MRFVDRADPAVAVVAAAWRLRRCMPAVRRLASARRGGYEASAVRVADFDFTLPPERIARASAEPRESARLLVHTRAGRTTEHTRVAELPRFLRAGDLLVLNDTRVVPWRLCGKRGPGWR